MPLPDPVVSELSSGCPSRGAASATFVEMNRKSAAVVRRNLTQLDVRSPEARVLSGDIFRLSARGSLPGAPFQIVLLDPPYATDPEDLAQLLASLMEHGSLTEGSLVLHERAEQNKTLGECRLFDAHFF